VIRNLYQSLMYVALCGEEYIQLIIRVLVRPFNNTAKTAVLPHACPSRHPRLTVRGKQQYLAPDSWKVDGAIREIIEEGQASFRRIDDAHASSAAPSSPRWGRAKVLHVLPPPPPHPCVPPITPLTPTLDDPLQEVPIKPPSATASVFLFYWQCFMSVLLLLFLLSCVAEFAQVRFHHLCICIAYIAVI